MEKAAPSDQDFVSMPILGQDGVGLNNVLSSFPLSNKLVSMIP